MNPRKLYMAQRTRKSLDEYIGEFEFELAAQSCPRHLTHVAYVCSLLLDKLEEMTGRTEETVAYTRQLRALNTRGVEMWRPRPDDGPGPVKARPRLRLVQEDQS